MITMAKRRRERGQTIILVAISVVALLAMAALAIDVVTLYVASSEIKRAADAVALAAAKAIADSGVTTLCATVNPPCAGPDPQFPAAKDLAASMVGSATTGAIGAVLPANTVAGAVPTLVSVDWSQAWTNQGNPIITVKLQQTNLPTFFARIWGRSGSTVSASSTAEVYNPSNNPAYTPIWPSSVKPWLLANVDVVSGGTLINPATGAVTPAVVADVMSKTFDITADCNGAISPCTLARNPPRKSLTGALDYVPAQVTSPYNSQDVCPSSCSGSTDYEQSIQCADTTQYQYLYCGAGTVQLNWDSSINPSGATGATATATECLIHAGGLPGPGNGQDTLDDTGWPTAPPQITAGSGPYASQLVSTSSSIVTIPVIDTTFGISSTTGPVYVVGFLQAFIRGVEPGMPFGTPTPGNVNITVLNIVGCANPNVNSGNTPIVGGRGTSPVAVRLIAPTS